MTNSPYYAYLTGFLFILGIIMTTTCMTSCSTTTESKVYDTQEDVYDAQEAADADRDWQKLWSIMDTCKTCVITVNYTMNFTCVVDTADDDLIIHIAPGH